MKILQAHNLYRHPGGEDIVAEQEYQILTQADIRIEKLRFTNDKLSGSSFILNKRSYSLVKERIASFSPDIFHVHNLFYEATPSILKAAKEMKVSVVMTLHNYRMVCPNGLLLRNNKPCLLCVDKKFPVAAIKHKCFKNSSFKTAILSTSLYYYKHFKYWQEYVDKFIVLTPFAQKIITESSLDVEPQKIIVKPNSVDDLLVLKHKDKSDYLILGRISEEKGIRVAIEAFNRLPKLRLNIVGDGPEKDKLQKLSGPNINFTGRLEKEQVKQLFARSKALIFPSICYEGLPTSVLESFSAGVPVISSDISNIKDIVVNGKFGLNFKTGSSQSLVKVIEQFEKSNHEFFSNEVRKHYLNYFTHEKNIQNLMRIYNDLVT